MAADVAFGFDDRPTLTPHQATAAAALLKSIGTRDALALAANLSRQAKTDAEARQEVILTDEEKSVLLDALTELAEHALPDQLQVLKAELAAELGR